MNTIERLIRIKAECEMLLEHPMYRDSARAVAGFRTTIAAIDSLQSIMKTRFNEWTGDSGVRAEAENALDEVISA